MPIPPPSWCDLNFEPSARAERFYRLHVLIKRKSVRDHRLAVDDAFDKQRECSLEAVQNGHRTDDLDLVVVDTKRRDGGCRIGRSNTKHQERAAPRDMAYA